MFWQDLKTYEKWNDLFKLYNDTIQKEKESQIPESERELNANDWKRKGTGWGSVEDHKIKKYKFSLQQSKTLEGLATCTANGLLNPVENEILHYRLIVDEYNQQLKEVDKLVDKERSNPNRPPSPPPIYDGYGNKMNTLKQRIIDRITKYKRKAMQRLIDLNPLQTLGISRTQVTKKIYIPVKEYPNYNFMGLIIGPRATTLKYNYKNIIFIEQWKLNLVVKFM